MSKAEAGAIKINNGNIYDIKKIVEDELFSSFNCELSMPGIVKYASLKLFKKNELYQTFIQGPEKNLMIVEKLSSEKISFPQMNGFWKKNLEYIC